MTLPTQQADTPYCRSRKCDRRFLDDDDLTLRTAEEAVELLKRIPMEEGIGFTLLIMALTLRRRDLAAARATLLEAIDHFERIDHRMGISQAVSTLVEVTRPDPELAARLIGGLRALDEVTFAAGPIEPGVGDRITAQAMAALGKERFAELVAEGAEARPGGAVGAGWLLFDRP